MADRQQLQLIRLKGSREWNRWRTKNPNIYPDLRGANLIEANLSGANLRLTILEQAKLTGANLSGADISWSSFEGAKLRGAKLSGAACFDASFVGADLSGADLFKADLRQADFRYATLCEANLYEANLYGANLSSANFIGANLSKASLLHTILIETNLQNAILTDAQIYGASVWDVNLQDAAQTNLVITKEPPAITVDNLEVAQFIYLLLNNSRIRNVIDTITSKTVLILGRFTPKRKATLDALRDALRGHDYIPILFDFEKPTNRDFTETVSTLAHLARFVIADLTDPRSIPQELMAVIPRLLSVPIRPLLLGSQKKWGMFSDLQRFPQVIPPLHYTNDATLLSCLETQIIAPAEQKARELSTK